MDNIGHIRLYRSLLNSQVFSHQTALKIWIWCLLKASHKDRYVNIKTGKGETTVKIFQGQFLFGRHKAEEELGIDGSTIYRWINKFSSKDFENMISLDVNNHYTIVSISNWATYQGLDEVSRTTNEQPMNSQCTTNALPMNTYNNDNNDNNDNTVKGKISKDKKTIYADFVSMLPEEHEKLKEEFGEQGVLRMIEILNNYKGSKGKQYKSDYLAIRNWVVTRYNEEKNKPTTASPKNVNQYWDNVN